MLKAKQIWCHNKVPKACSDYVLRDGGPIPYLLSFADPRLKEY